MAKALLRLKSSSNPLGLVTSYTDKIQRQVVETDPLGRETETEYDAASRVIARVEPTGDRTTFGYDPADRQTSVEDPLRHVTLHDYDSAGRLVDQ